MLHSHLQDVTVSRQESETAHISCTKKWKDRDHIKKQNKKKN